MALPENVKHVMFADDVAVFIVKKYIEEIIGAFNRTPLGEHSRFV